MGRRFRVRLDERLADAEVHPGLLRGMEPRLETFLRPFVAALHIDAQKHNATHYTRGLLANLKAKNVEAIADLHDQERQALQTFIGQSPWDHEPLPAELVRRVGQELGAPDGVLVFDPSAFPKKGTGSVGVARQWCGRLGKVENGQVGIYLGYVTRREHALVDFRLYLPREWTNKRKRMAEAGAPKEVRFRTRHELLLEMLDGRGEQLPHGWVSGDDELGRCGWFRQELQGRREVYRRAVPSNTSVRDLATRPPGAEGRGGQRKTPFARVDRWCAGLPARAWQTIEVRAAEHGPRAVEMARGFVQARTDGRVSQVVEQVVVFRARQGDGSWKHDYLPSNAPLTVGPEDLAGVFKSQHRIEECLRRAESEAGLGSYQVRTWEGWHHHQTRSLVATWFLTQETRRGKKAAPGVDRPACPGGDRAIAESVAGV
jgi:SRSO17 transposase